MGDCKDCLAPACILQPQGDCCNASGVRSTAQQAGASSSQQASGAGFAQRLWALPFKQRVELCNDIFQGAEPVRQTLQEHGASGNDGFALQTE